MAGLAALFRRKKQLPGQQQGRRAADRSSLRWAVNKYLVTPALQKLVDAGVLTVTEEHTVEQAADLLLNALTELGAKKVATPAT
jgi:hypothetical protein